MLVAVPFFMSTFIFLIYCRRPVQEFVETVFFRFLSICEYQNVNIRFLKNEMLKYDTSYTEIR